VRLNSAGGFPFCLVSYEYAEPSESTRMKVASPTCHAGLADSSLVALTFRLDLGSAAVNEQFDTRDETGIGREKQRHLSNFLGFPLKH
jgi:hypothetical protein